MLTNEGEREMRATRLREMLDMAMKLLATARQLPPRQDHHNALQEIARSRAQPVGQQRPDVPPAHRGMKAKGK